MNNYLMKFEYLKDSIFYRLACDCTSQDCDLTIELEKDPRFGMVFLNMYKKLRASAHWGEFWDHCDFIRVFINKMKLCWCIMIHGFVEVSEGFVIKEPEHFDQFIAALIEGKQLLHQKNEEKEKL